MVRDGPAWGRLCYPGPSIPYLQALPCRQEAMEVSQNDTLYWTAPQRQVLFHVYVRSVNTASIESCNKEETEAMRG